MRLLALGIQPSKVRHACCRKVRLYLSAPAIFQTPGFLLSFATAAADVHSGDIADAEFNLGPGFDID
jgi:hypothetical protein